MSVGISRKRRMEKCNETGNPREVRLKRLGLIFWLLCRRSSGGGGGLLVVVVVALVVVVVVGRGAADK
jgi:hypothetical protein